MTAALQTLALLASPAMRQKDASVWTRMGKLCAKMGNDKEAFSHFAEAQRCVLA